MDSSEAIHKAPITIIFLKTGTAGVAKLFKHFGIDNPHQQRAPRGFLAEQGRALCCTVFVSNSFSHESHL